MLIPLTELDKLVLECLIRNKVDSYTNESLANLLSRNRSSIYHALQRLHRLGFIDTITKKIPNTPGKGLRYYSANRRSEEPLKILESWRLFMLGIPS